MNDDSIMRGAVATALSRLDDAMLPLRAMLACDSPESQLAAQFMHELQTEAIQELRAQAVVTNDVVEIGDNILEVLNSCRVRINGASVDLEVRELLVLFVPARQARRLARRPGTGLGADARFMRLAELVDRIDRAKEEAGLKDLWQHAIDTDIHKAVSSPRRELGEAGLNRNLVEGRRGDGYRLSTPHWNLVNPERAHEPG